MIYFMLNMKKERGTINVKTKLFESLEKNGLRNLITELYRKIDELAINETVTILTYIYTDKIELYIRNGNGVEVWSGFIDTDVWENEDYKTIYKKRHTRITQNTELRQKLVTHLYSNDEVWSDRVLDGFTLFYWSDTNTMGSD